MIRAAFLILGSFFLLTVLSPQKSWALETDGQATVKAHQNILPDLTSGIIERLAASTKKKRKSCPEGQERDPSTGECFSCSHNDHFENGECVPCRQGFHQEGDECVADVRKKKKSKNCPEGMEFTRGKCRQTEFPPIEQCPEGQQPDPNSGVCFSCSHNDHFENGRCVPCKAGFHVEGDQCVAD